MTTDFLARAVPGVQSLSPYVPGKPADELARELGITRIVKLASNENPLGPGPRARAALATALDDLGRYPDGNGFVLKSALSTRFGLPQAAFTLGNGSNDVLEIIIRAFAGPGDEVVYSQYAFAVYALVTQAVGATARVAPARDYGHDLAAMRALVGPKTRLVCIANPNNPTGTLLGAPALLEFLADLPAEVICVLDEAYCEYLAQLDYPEATQWLARFPNLVISRTFSKIHGLAGLRVGYAAADPAITAVLNRVRQPFNVNSPALLAAAAALDDAEHIAASCALNSAGLAQLAAGLGALGLHHIPSSANFLTVEFPGPAQPIYQALLERGVIVRPLANYGLPNHLRISAGLPEENAFCLAALAEVLASAADVLTRVAG